MFFELYQFLPAFDAVFVQVVLPASLVFGALFLAHKYPTRSSRAILLKLRGAQRKHNWKTVKYPQSRCTHCERLLTTAESYGCDYCGVFADGCCLKIVNDTIGCKMLSSDNSGPMKHQYIPGNILDGPECDICEEEWAGQLKCIWCHRRVHLRCRQMLGEICDFGKWKTYVVPPNCVAKNRKTTRSGRNGKLYNISSPSWAKNWTPLFIAANKKSGDNMGEAVLSSFREILNPLQVVDLSEKDPTFLCQLLSSLPEEAKPRVLVAGGDGTVAWVLTTVAEFKLKSLPPVGIVPLGTGNDLSRVLGWGAEERRPFSAANYVARIESAAEQRLDRWNIQLTKMARRSLRFTLAEKDMSMYNYMSVGVDALVTLDFHEARRSPFYIYSSRLINKMLYLLFGTQQVMERQCQGLQDRLELYMDGKRIDLPEIESVVLLNIPSWGAGVKLWELGADPTEDQLQKQDMSDSKLEVMGISSSFHVAQLQLGLSKPYRFGQASHVKIVLKAAAPVQVDGEPWRQVPCQIDVTTSSQALLLSATTDDPPVLLEHID